MLTQDAFRAKKGHICPHCGYTEGATIKGDEWTDEGHYEAYVKCSSCDKEWTTLWVLAGFLPYVSA